MVAVGYVRRSESSGTRTVSIEDQQARIADYCAERGWTLAETVIDDGISGGKRERLVRLDSVIRARRAGVVVVYHLDRLARDAAALLDWLERAGRRGIELHVVGRGRIEAQTSTGYLVAGVEGIVAAHYRKLVGEKTRDAMARLRAKGRRVSRFTPFGYTLAPDHMTLVPDRAEQDALAMIRAMAPGRSLRALSAALADRGILARNGRPFAPFTLSRLVAVRSSAVNNGPLVDTPATAGVGA
jgi:DNA invertase Pin-like site-specific DNA recombinase